MAIYRTPEPPRRRYDFSRVPSELIVAGLVGAGLLGLLALALTRGGDPPSTTLSAVATPTPVPAVARAAAPAASESTTAPAGEIAAPPPAPVEPTATATVAVLAAEVTRDQPAPAAPAVSPVAPAAPPAAPAASPAINLAPPTAPVHAGPPADHPEGLASLQGQIVRYEGVKVLAVAGPDSFWIGSKPEESLFVIVEETPDADDVGAAGLEAGQTVNLIGAIRKMPDREQRDDWVLYEGSAEALESQPVYLHVVNERAYHVAR